MAIFKGEERFFVPELQYNEEHARKIVRVVEVGNLVSLVMTDNGKRFAPFNTELKRIKEPET